MLFRMSFKEQVKQVYLVFFDKKCWIPMERSATEKNIWSIDIPVLNRRCVYKYAINKSIRINDPKADEYVIMSDGEVWSVVDKEKNESIAYKESLLKMISLTVLNKDMISLDTSILTEDKPHTVSIIWHQSNGKIVLFEEYCIMNEVKNVREYSFQLNLLNKQKRNGLYKVALLIDGEQVYSNYFCVSQMKNLTESYLDISI